METIITAVIVAGIVLAGQALYGWGACAFVVAAFLLWWDGQPGPHLDRDLS